MIRSTFRWRLSEEQLPEESGSYICITGVMIQHIHYSSKHKMFNCHDTDTPEEAKRTSIYVHAWAPMPGNVEKLMEEAWLQRCNG